MTQIAVKLPDPLLEMLDELVAAGAYPSRSQAVRSALEQLVTRARADRIDHAFSEGFARSPERPHELAEAHRLAVEAIHDEPWKPWW